MGLVYLPTKLDSLGGKLWVNIPYIEHLGMNNKGDFSSDRHV